MTYRPYDRFRPESSPGPATGTNATFMCACCGIAKLVTGRRRAGNRYWCADCVTTGRDTNGATARFGNDIRDSALQFIRGSACAVTRIHVATAIDRSDTITNRILRALVAVNAVTRVSLRQAATGAAIYAFHASGTALVIPPGLTAPRASQPKNESTGGAPKRERRAKEEAPAIPACDPLMAALFGGRGA